MNKGLLTSMTLSVTSRSRVGSSSVEIASAKAVVAESVRRERRLIVAAFLTLFGTLMAQSLLETARDALVLTHVPISRLPWLTLSMALLTLMVGSLPTKRGGTGATRVVSVALLVGAGATATLWWTLAKAAPLPLYLFFLWSGVFASFVVGQIWTIVAETIDMGSAKRVYGRLAAGGGLGAVVGAAAARLLSAHVEPRLLVLIAAALAVTTALGPGMFLRRPAARTPTRRRDGVTVSGRARVRFFAQAYVTRLVAVAVVAAAASTLLDFAFKEVVVAHVSTQQLPRFIATFHLLTSGASLLLQLFGVALVVRLVGVGRVQIWLPALLLAATVVTMVTGGLAAIVLLRGLETIVRSSFQRPTLELLQMPLGDRIRRRAKPIVDSVAQRAGQALAAVALLAMFQLAAGSTARFIAVAALLAVWLVVALGLGRRYVDMLRATLLQPKVATNVELGSYADGAGRATLVAALDSACAREVRAAVDLLIAYGEAGLIPATLLNHKSSEVVRRVIEAIPVDAELEKSGLLLAKLDHLIAGHGDLSVRQAALRRRATVAPDQGMLTRLARNADCPTLRAMSLVILVANGWCNEEHALAQLRLLAESGGFAVRFAIAECLAEQPSASLHRILFYLADGSEPDVVSKVADSLGRLGGPEAISALVRWLGNRDTRDPACAALRKLGRPAFDATQAALVDLQQPVALRANVPRALVDIDPERALVALMDGLLIESDGFVRFRILRALNRLRRVRPDAALDEDILGRAAMAACDSAYRYLGWRVFLEDGASRKPRRRTATWRLMRELLAEKEQNAIERLFRVLTLRYPSEDFRRLLRTLRTGSRRTRAAGRELIANLLSGPAQALTLALLNDTDARGRFAALSSANSGGTETAAAPPRPPSYGALLNGIRLAENGGTLAALATQHADELEGMQHQALARSTGSPPAVVAHA